MKWMDCPKEILQETMVLPPKFIGRFLQSLKKVPETLDSWDVLGYSSPLQ